MKTIVALPGEGIGVEVVDVAGIDIAPPALSLTGPAGTSVPISYVVKDSHGKALDLKPTWTSAPDGAYTRWWPRAR